VSLVSLSPAQQAVCKVRTEVMEVTRSMLDRRNANFLLWPPCVEVQRCSGCCNTRLLQCVPTVTSSRYLQVIKIQYINKKAHYEKAIISVEDHVSCRCQTLSSSSSSSPSSSSSSTQRKPTQTWGEHADFTQKGPGQGGLKSDLLAVRHSANHHSPMP
uniref:Platelet-derived growth factor (PDGF) family profile domain-containing protein n=1 Tax=Amphilophus citrinellus TaxID=61819 RepID=A0A3Q0R6G0_AMPCI